MEGMERGVIKDFTVSWRVRKRSDLRFGDRVLCVRDRGKG